MKKVLLFLLVLSISFISMSCEEEAAAIVQPQFRIYADANTESSDYTGTVYGALGTYNASLDTFTTVSDWVSASGGSFSSYSDVIAGTYTVLRDYDTDHSRATVWTTFSYTFENEKKYSIVFNAAGGFTISLDN